MDKRAEDTCYRMKFPYASSGKQNGAFSYIVLRLKRLTYARWLDSINRAFPIEVVIDLLLFYSANVGWYVIVSFPVHTRFKGVKIQFKMYYIFNIKLMAHST